MAATVIDCDGKNVPRELRILPPGRYALSPLQDAVEITSEEDAAVRKALDELAAGDVVSLDQVIREFEARSRRP